MNERRAGRRSKKRHNGQGQACGEGQGVGTPDTEALGRGQRPEEARRAQGSHCSLEQAAPGDYQIRGEWVGPWPLWPCARHGLRDCRRAHARHQTEVRRADGPSGRGPPMADGVAHFAGEDTEDSVVYTTAAAKEAGAVMAAVAVLVVVSVAAVAAEAVAAAEAARMATGDYTAAVGISGEHSWDGNYAQTEGHGEVGRREGGQRS